MKGRHKAGPTPPGTGNCWKKTISPSPPSLQEEATRLTSEAQTVIWFADEENVLAIAGITDRIKETSIRAVSELRAAGIEVHMLTGDNEATAREIARKAGIAHYQASVLPQDRLPSSAGCRQKAGRLPWWATASTTAPPLPKPT